MTEYSNLSQLTQILFIYYSTSVLLVDIALLGKSYKSERDSPAMSKRKKTKSLDLVFIVVRIILEFITDFIDALYLYKSTSVLLVDIALLGKSYSS